MSATSLKELDAKAADDKSLLDLFQHCRVHVVAVAATDLMPDCLAVTTQGGFVELIDTSTGEFRLFLAHLDRIPLDASLRCFSLVPSYFNDGVAGGPFLALSLAYSNELLMADLSTGEASVLATLDARPRSVFCDGDYLVCGDGGGCVTAWRANAGAARGTGLVAPTRMWQRAVFDDTVATLRVHRDELFCASADYQCVVLSVDTGLVVARVAREPSPLVAVVPLREPSVQAPVVALCSESRIAVYVESWAAPQYTSAVPGAAAAAASPEATWALAGGVSLDVEVQCATYCGGYLAVGTASGVVLLFHCDAASALVSELVRFDVGHGVVGLQLYASESLVVVTAAGDVWKWPLKDLLDNAEEEDNSAAASEGVTPAAVHAAVTEGSDDDDDEPRPSDELPMPMDVTRPPILDCTAAPETDDSETLRESNTSAAMRRATEASSDAAGQEDDTRGERESPFPHISVSSADTSPSRRSPDTSNHTTGDHSIVAEPSTQPQLLSPPVLSARTAAAAAAADDSDEPIATVAKTKAATSALSEAAELLDMHVPTHVEGGATAAASGGDGGEDGGGGGERAAFAVVDDTSQRDEAAGAPPTATGSRGEPRASAGGRQRSPPLALAAVGPRMEDYRRKRLADVERVLGAPPPEVIPGLRAGKRMNQDRIQQALASEAMNTEADEEDDKDACPPAPQLQSTAMLLERKEHLRTATFDFAAYAQEHPLEVAALPYQHPIRPVRYTLQDRVFEEVEGSTRLGITDGDPSRAAAAGDGGHLVMDRTAAAVAPGQGPEHAVRDDLMDATHGRVVRRVDPVWAEERSRKGPDIYEHPCSDLLFLPAGPPETVLFKEYQMKPVDPQPLLLPMPLPPSPSVF